MDPNSKEWLSEGKKESEAYQFIIQEDQDSFSRAMNETYVLSVVCLETVR